ncbi:MAG: hypothetical protein K6G15_10480, partial [Desulfovibrio sp.]|nr:hypothetical protein [Desulfovibrio sp.]
NPLSCHARTISILCSRLRLTIKKPPVLAGGLHKKFVFEKRGGWKAYFSQACLIIPELPFQFTLLVRLSL